MGRADFVVHGVSGALHHLEVVSRCDLPDLLLGGSSAGKRGSEIAHVVLPASRCVEVQKFDRGIARVAEGVDHARRHAHKAAAPVRDFLDGEVYEGRAAIRAFWEYLFEEVWESVRMVEERLVDAGDTVVAMVGFQGVGRSSGAPVDLPIAWTFEFRNGCIARVKINLDRAEALDAVGRAE
jgi:ketosteroid isomerase-like protein